MKKEKVKPKSKKSLRDLIDSINWKAIETTRGATKLPLDAVSVQFTQKDKKKADGEKADVVRVRIGQQVLEKLGWEPGSKIFVAYDPDDELTFLLTQVESKNGHSLGQETGTHSCRLAFTWAPDRILMKSTKTATFVEYEIHKKQLIFRAKQED